MRRIASPLVVLLCLTAANFSQASTPPPPTPVLTTLVVQPQDAKVPVNGTVNYTAVGMDQNGHPMPPPTAAVPAPVWSVSGGGTIDAKTGVFTATTLGGPYTVTATVGTISGTATVMVANPTTTQVLTSIAITPKNPQVPVNGKVPFFAVGLDQNGQPMQNQPPFGWSVSGGGQISNTGVFTAGATAGGPFTVTVSVPAGNTGAAVLSATTTLTVVGATPPPPVLTSVAVTPHEATVVAGGTVHFYAQGLDQNGGPMPETAAPVWTVSGGGTIDASGLFTAGTTPGGSFTVTATIGTVSGTATVAIVLPPPPTTKPVLTAIAVSPRNAAVPLSGTLNYTAVGLDQNGSPLATQPTFSWKVSGGGTINATSGVFTAGATAGGPFTVTASVTTTTGGSATAVVSGTAIVVVGNPNAPPPPAPNPILTKIAVAPHDVHVPVGTKVAFVAIGLDQNGAPMPTAQQPATVVWTVSGGGTIDATGLFTATTVGGPFTVTATVGTLTGTANIAVTSVLPPTPNPNPVLASVKVCPQDAEVPTGGKLAMQAIGLDQNGAPLAIQPAFTWTVSNPAASIDSNGVFTSTTAGEYVVTAASGTVSGTASVEVFAPKAPPTAKQILTSIEVEPNPAIVALGGTVKFHALGKDQNGFPMAQQPAFTWTVSAGGTIDSNGVFTGTLTGGAYTVTAAAGTVSGTASVTVLSALSIVSGPLALPNPAFIGDNVHFFAYVAGSGALTEVWDFGDNTAAFTGPNPIHVYKAVGSYTVTLTVTDANANQATGTLAMSVVATAPAPTPGTHSFAPVLLSAKLNFAAASSDALQLNATLSDWDSTVALAGLAVNVNIGGVTQAFTLDATGSATVAGASFKLDPHKKIIGVRISNGSFAAAWAALGVDPTMSTPPGSLLFPVTITFNGVDYTGDAMVLYSSKAGKGAVLRPTQIVPGKTSKK